MKDKEYEEYLLEWIVHYIDTITKEEHHDYMHRYFKTLWDARCYAYKFDDHVSDIKIYKLEEKFQDE